MCQQQQQEHEALRIEEEGLQKDVSAQEFSSTERTGESLEVPRAVP